MVVATGALKCILNVSLPEEKVVWGQFGSQDKDSAATLAKCDNWVRCTIKTHLLRGCIPICSPN